MKIVCPNNPNHNMFRVTTHVTQDWLVCEQGEFEEVLDSCVEVTHGANADSYYECHECGAEAVVELD